MSLVFLFLALCGLSTAASRHHPIKAASGNPFEGNHYYVNPSFVKELDGSIATATGKTKETLESMRNISSAYWLDTKEKIRGTNTSTMEGILNDASKQNPIPLVIFIVYDLPNRDCAAGASNGEICCTKNSDGTCDYNAQGNCEAGIQEYQTEYIDVIASVIKNYGNVPTVLIIEPDSLPNLATNTGNPHCGNSATQNAYKTGIPYAIKTLAQAAPHAAMYVDAAHGGWLGWENNIQKFVELIQPLGITQYIRGFSQNVANYQPLGSQCPTTQWCLNGQHQSDPCCKDPCKLEGQYNPANNEHNYAMELVAAMEKAFPGFSPRNIIDTGRNGVDGERQSCSDWCNIRGAGVGHVPTYKTQNATILDAYMWLKTPGESDGCTQYLPAPGNPFKKGAQCPRYDPKCGSPDSIGTKSGEPYAPTAGAWFDYQIKQLASNANMQL